MSDVRKTGKEEVNKPDHYVRGRKFEPLDVIEDWGLHQNHYLACVVKYVARYGRKDQDNPVRDLEKAMFYLKREIERRGREDEAKKKNVVTLSSMEKKV